MNSVQGSTNCFPMMSVEDLKIEEIIWRGILLQFSIELIDKETKFLCSQINEFGLDRKEKNEKSLIHLS